MAAEIRLQVDFVPFGYQVKTAQTALRRLSQSTFWGIIHAEHSSINPTEVINMTTVTITEILDDLRAADEITRRFERRYWLSSADFYELYSQGLLDDGEHTEDFALWAAFHEIKLDREKDLQQLSKERMRQFKEQAKSGAVQITPQEPVIEVLPA